MQVVWFKRDLRVNDHRPLFDAARRAREGAEPVLCLYVVEPSLWASEEMSAFHGTFIDESLVELDARLRERGAQLTVRRGEMPEVLEALHRRRPVTALWSHRETGNQLTYDRDLRVKGWCAARGVPWTERGQDGVVRRLESRDGWAARWRRRMHRPLTPAPELIPSVTIDAGPRPGDLELGREAPGGGVPRQRGGESRGLETLRGFLRHRGEPYQRAMSSPLDGFGHCSRLSPHLAWGTVSLRRVVQATERRGADRRGRKGTWGPSLKAFRSRLAWHCHFMQRLEDEPAIEFRNINRAFDGLREDDWNQDHFDAWRAGLTGYPMVDACMRSLRATGWLNFRMRAMLVSFACHDLWLHWRRPAIHLARCFVDFEPGIHFSQVQMQAGTTGINALRVYNPTKQLQEHDPRGHFVRFWVPELRGVPDVHLAEPWRMGGLEQRAVGCVVGRDYPEPIVDHRIAARKATRRIAAVRHTLEGKREAKRVFAKHGSRKGPPRRRRP